MTIADVLVIDRETDLASIKAVQYALLPDPVTQRVTLPLVFDFLYRLTKEASERPGFRGGWHVWTTTLRAIRRLLREPQSHQKISRPELVRAIHLVGVFRWAPLIATRTCPGRKPSVTEILKAYTPDKASAPGINDAIEFWASLEDDGADDLFIRDGDEKILPSAAWPQLTCERCGEVNNRTLKGRLPRRSLCVKCKKWKENQAWKKKDQERARRLWRAAAIAARQKRKSGESDG